LLIISFELQITRPPVLAPVQEYAHAPALALLARQRHPHIHISAAVFGMDVSIFNMAGLPFSYDFHLISIYGNLVAFGTGLKFLF
jgi:hypothetical protein